MTKPGFMQITVILILWDMLKIDIIWEDTIKICDCHTNIQVNVAFTKNHVASEANLIWIYILVLIANFSSGMHTPFVNT